MKEQRAVYHGRVIVSTPTGRAYVYADSEGTKLVEDGYKHVVHECTYTDDNGNPKYKLGGTADDYNAACRSIGEEVGRAMTLGEAIQIARHGKVVTPEVDDEPAD